MDTEAEAMERANGLREMDYVMPDPDTIQDYHSELVKLGYEIINHEDGTGYISDPDGKLLAEWDKKDDSYRWAGLDNGQADSEFHNRKKYAEEKYGSADNYWDLERD